MKTMTKKELYKELERERLYEEIEREGKSAVRVLTIGVIACVIAVVAVVLLLLANEKEPKKETKYVEQIMIA